MGSIRFRAANDVAVESNQQRVDFTECAAARPHNPPSATASEDEYRPYGRMRYLTMVKFELELTPLVHVVNGLAEKD